MRGMTAFPGTPRRAAAPRVAPGGVRDIGPVNAALCGAIGLATPGRRPPNVFTTLARHRRLFRGWLRFAGRLMPRGTLPRRDTELVILRVSLLCGSDYEWAHHDRIGRQAGLTEAQIARVAEGPEADGWDEHERALLAACDELGRDNVISEATWGRLRARYDERQLMELCLLAGHYRMLAGALNSLGVRPEA